MLLKAHQSDSRSAQGEVPTTAVPNQLLIHHTGSGRIPEPYFTDFFFFLKYVVCNIQLENKE